MITKHSIWNKFLRPAAGLALLLVLIACTPEMLSKIEPAAPAAGETGKPAEQAPAGGASVTITSHSPDLLVAETGTATGQNSITITIPQAG